MLAGFSVAGLLFPEAVAYAGFGGVAPQAAIMAASITATPNLYPAQKADMTGELILVTGVLFILAFLLA